MRLRRAGGDYGVFQRPDCAPPAGCVALCSLCVEAGTVSDVAYCNESYESATWHSRECSVCADTVPCWTGQRCYQPGVLPTWINFPTWAQNVANDPRLKPFLQRTAAGMVHCSLPQSLTLCFHLRTCTACAQGLLGWMCHVQAGLTHSSPWDMARPHGMCPLGWQWCERRCWAQLSAALHGCRNSGRAAWCQKRLSGSSRSASIGHIATSWNSLQEPTKPNIKTLFPSEGCPTSPATS